MNLSAAFRQATDAFRLSLTSRVPRFIFFQDGWRGKGDKHESSGPPAENQVPIFKTILPKLLDAMVDAFTLNGMEVRMIARYMTGPADAFVARTYADYTFIALKYIKQILLLVAFLCTEK